MNGLPSRFWTKFLLGSCLVFFLNSAASTQTQSPSQPLPPTAYKLISVTVTGSKRFSSDQIALASGLPVGTIAHEEDFKKAARQLGDSGAFGDINFTYTYSSAGTKLEFHVIDADKFVPARFIDFVWFTGDQLRREIHTRVPLFDGELPINGRLAGEVSDVLQAMLVEKGLAGDVQFQRTSEKNGQLESIDYTVAGVSIRIHRTEFPGAGAGELPQLEAAGERLTDREYSRDYMNTFVEHSLLPIFRERGFLKASCGIPQPKVVTPANAELDLNQRPRTYVDVTFPVTPGLQYKLAGWEWSGNEKIATTALQPLIHAKVGETANTVQLGDDLRAVQELYGSRGYVTASIRVDTNYDDAAGTVAYILRVNEGPVYHMGELQFRGLDNSLEARLRAAWKLRPGEVYDASYLNQYLPLARKLLPSTLDWEVTSHVTAMTTDKTVDVDLQYMAKAPK